MSKRPRRSSNNSSSAVTVADLILLEYEDRRLIIPRPLSYNELQLSVRRYITDIPQDAQVTYHTDALPVCRGALAQVTSDVWPTVIQQINSLTVVSKLPQCPDSPKLYTVPRPFLPTPSEAKSQNRMTISIDYQGKIKVLRVLASTTAHAIMRIYQKTEGIRSLVNQRFRLTYDDGEWLHDNETLLDQDVEGMVQPCTYTAKRLVLSLAPQWKFSTIYPIVPIEQAPESIQAIEWLVHASPNGTLNEQTTGLEVAYLFWEAVALQAPLPISPPSSPQIRGTGEEFIPDRPSLTDSNSVVIPVDKVSTYLDSVLRTLGLHAEARTSFITYWLPSIEKHPYVAMRFLPQHAYERAAPLDVTPAPDVVLRVFMLFTGIKENQLEDWPAAVRRIHDDPVFWREVIGVNVSRVLDGRLFRVIEWGGMEVQVQ